MQILGNHFEEETVLRAGHAFEQATDHHLAASLLVAPRLLCGPVSLSINLWSRHVLSGTTDHRAKGGWMSRAEASSWQSRVGFRPLVRTAASSVFGGLASARKAGSACNLATVPAPINRPSITSLCQWTPQITRLCPKARPRARSALHCSGAISLRMSAQAQPTAECPDGYEPLAIRCFSSLGGAACFLVHNKRADTLIVILGRVGGKTRIGEGAAHQPIEMRRIFLGDRGI